MSDDLPAQPSPTSDDESRRADAWLALRRFTAARIALGRTGASLPTRELLAFGVAHAQARDAVHAPLDADALASVLESSFDRAVLRVATQADDRAAYLARPDWGRKLSGDARQGLLEALKRGEGASSPDVVFVLADGLSATAVQRHAVPFLEALLPLLGNTCAIAPFVIATGARVALADEVGEAVGAKIAISLIGERPGLSSADSLGVYLTYAPKPDRNDSERNCISNVRPEGLPPAEAAAQAAALVRAALAARKSGVALRFDPAAVLPGPD